MYSCHVSFIHVISSALRSCHALLVTHALLLMPCYKTHIAPAHSLPSAAPLPYHVVFTHVMLPLGRSFHVILRSCQLHSCHVVFTPAHQRTVCTDMTKSLSRNSCRPGHMWKANPSMGQRVLRFVFHWFLPLNFQKSFSVTQWDFSV